jgi:hypothetical protein
MTKYRISTPQAGFTGVSVGVNFTDGHAEIDSEVHASALRYFLAQDYGIEEVKAKQAKASKPADPPAKTFADDPAIAPAGNASAEDWRAHVLALGAAEDLVKDLGRDPLKDLAAKLAAAKQKEQTA